MSREKVLVLCSTGKVGRNVCLALSQANFEVFGTTRSESKYLPSIGVTPVIADYTQRADLDRAFAQTRAKKVFVLTDYFRAASVPSRRFAHKVSGASPGLNPPRRSS